MSIWDLRGTEQQNELVRRAIAACDFPFDVLRPSLQREGKQAIRVEWADLSRYNHGEDEHEHAEGAHTISRPVDGRMRVLGLFYLPPYTKVVLDNGLVTRPTLAAEVFLAEGAHAVDYHWMVHHEHMRRAVWNAVHEDHHDLPDGTHVPESGDIGHGHSWFDGAGGYSTWVGETFMEAFIRAFSPTIPVTINLSHPVSARAAAEIRAALLPEQEAPEPEQEVPEPVDPPQPPEDGGGSGESGSGSEVYWSGKRSKVYHDKHGRIEPVKWYDSSADAEADGLRACKVCRPS